MNEPYELWKRIRTAMGEFLEPLGFTVIDEENWLAPRQFHVVVFSNGEKVIRFTYGGDDFSFILAGAVPRPGRQIVEDRDWQWLASEDFYFPKPEEHVDRIFASIVSACRTYVDL